MQWLDQLNQALDELERSLRGEIDYAALARRACCSAYHFQRMFSYIAGVPLGEYIRRRRMTLAACDLQSGDRVLDVALRYGYGSPTAFNRAFQSVHGVPPSAAREPGAVLKAYGRISFKITVKGEVEMQYRIEQKEAFRIVGLRFPLSRELEQNFREVPQFWGKAGPQLPRLLGLMNAQPMGVMGVSASCDGEDWAYYIGVASDQPAPEGCESYTVPAGSWAVFPGQGAMPSAIQELERRAVTEWLPASGYEYADGPDIELYLDADPQNARFEVWMPVRRREE